MKNEILLDWIKSLFEQNETLMGSFKNLADTIPIKMKQIHKKHVEESSMIKEKTLENEKSVEVTQMFSLAYVSKYWWHYYFLGTKHSC